MQTLLPICQVVDSGALTMGFPLVVLWLGALSCSLVCLVYVVLCWVGAFWGRSVLPIRWRGSIIFSFLMLGAFLSYCAASWLMCRSVQIGRLPLFV